MKVSSYLSDSERAKRTRRRRMFMFCAMGCVGLVVIGAAWVVRYAPFLEVKRVVVEGTSRMKEDEVLTVVRGMALKGTLSKWVGIERLFAWPEVDVQNLALLPAAAHLSISKSYLARTVRVRVEERQPEGVWCLLTAQTDVGMTQTDADAFSSEFVPFQREAASGQRSSTFRCWWFDREGILFARALDSRGGLLKTVHDYSGRVIGAGAAALPPPLMRNLLSIFEVLRESGAVPDEVRLEDIANEEVEVVTLNGPRLYFSLRFPLGGVADVVRQMFSSPPAGGGSTIGGLPPAHRLEYVDFRVENRVYYK
jgi:hypothetical protein